MKGLMLFIALAVISCVMAASDVIMKPSHTGKTAKQSAAMILAPGFGIGADAYEPLGEALQNAFAQEDISLYFGVPHMAGNITTVGLTKAISRVAASLTDAGLPDDHSTFYSGHSVGGALMPYILKDLKNLPDGFNKPNGMILMAAFLVREFRTESVPDVGPGQYTFPNCPVLSIGAELDGLARISRFAEAYHNQITLNNDINNAKKTLPITMITGMTHMQFASDSGGIPKEVMNKDLLPEISENDAHNAVAADVASFVNGLLNNNWDTLNSRGDQSSQLLKPLIDMMELEGYHQFKPPCYCEELDEYGGLEYGTCPEQPGCTAGSPWTAHAQQLMINPTDYKNGKGIIMESKDSQHIVTEEDPSCHLPHLHNGLDRDTGVNIPNSVANANPGSKGTPALCVSPDSCTLTSNTITQLKYQDGSEFDIWRLNIGNDNIDTSSYPITASEMKSKMKSRQSILQAANCTAAVNDATGYTFDALDDPSLGYCSKINEIAIETALNAVPEATRNRYLKYGQKMVASIEDKKVCIAGPCWIWASLEYEGRRANGDITINPPSFAFKNHNPYPCDEKKYPVDDRKVVLPCTAGMHYCKLLSPARVAEWIHVDSLRLNYSLKSQQKDDKFEEDEPKCCDSCPSGTDKYYSIPIVFNKNCGESCIAPEDYDMFKKFEPDLTLADSHHPCEDKGFTTYVDTETHEAGPISVELDMYTMKK